MVSSKILNTGGPETFCACATAEQLKANETDKEIPVFTDDLSFHQDKMLNE
jgi:hypothetical protein